MDSNDETDEAFVPVVDGIAIGWTVTGTTEGYDATGVGRLSGLILFIVDDGADICKEGGDCTVVAVVEEEVRFVDFPKRAFA